MPPGGFRSWLYSFLAAGAPPAPPPPPSPPAPQVVIQPTEVKAAKLTATAALIGALLGAAGASVPALIVANKQINAAAEQSRVTFLRAEQKAAYAALLSAHEELSKTEDAQRRRADSFLLGVGTGLGNGGAPPTLDDFGFGDSGALPKSYVDATSSIELVGSIDVLSATKDLTSGHYAYIEVITTAATCPLYQTRDRTVRDLAAYCSTELGSKGRDVSHAYRVLTEAMRRDLGTAAD